MIARISHRPAHSLGRRLLDGFRSRFVGGLGKSQRVYFVEIRGQRYKRVVFGDSAQAATVVAAIEACGHSIVLPRLIHQHENELWFEFVEGRSLSADDDEHREALARLFAALHAREPELVALETTALHDRFCNDLYFLEQAGVLDPERGRRLAAKAEAIRPVRAWFGLDYLDPVLKNFVLRERQVVIIDLESLGRRTLLGTGISKSVLHWLGDGRDHFTERVIELGAPEFRPQLDYAELLLVTAWTKRKLLAGKRRRIDLGHFDRCLR
jgi:hypothetical protein